MASSRLNSILVFALVLLGNLHADASSPAFEAQLVAGLPDEPYFAQGKALAALPNELFATTGRDAPGPILHWRRDTGGWSLAGTYQAPATATRAFGDAIAVNEQGWLAIGDPGVGVTPGNVHFYRRNFGGGYDWHSVVSSTTPRNSSWFGSSIQMDADRVFVGAPFEQNLEGESPYRGGIHMFGLQGDTWEHLTVFRSSDPEFAPRFGYRILLAGETLVSSDPYAPIDWVQSSGIVFHCALDPMPVICSNVLAVGAYYHALFGNTLNWGGQHTYVSAPGSSSSRGKVHVFLGPPGTASEIATIQAPDQEIGWSFGWTLGGTDRDLFVATGRGGDVIYRFEKTGSDWESAGRLAFPPPNYSGGSNWSQFGAGLLTSGDHLYISASGLNATGWTNVGSVFVYSLPLFSNGFED